MKLDRDEHRGPPVSFIKALSSANPSVCDPADNKTENTFGPQPDEVIYT